ncbi:Proprotein convertase P-domain-containing protein [Kibdelosporangium aridum]|uniref:Proprotein convertase P-domain-containing protein n=1 Tax=Kibdelosporangium aridum TaxID=2030 RepID=A0A1Y5WZW2_KIBAR|nr:Proprotein convertase P-domain-containing protein [Kibdelosporangium aridum]
MRAPIRPNRRFLAASLGVVLSLSIVSPAAAWPDPAGKAADNASKQISALQELKRSQSAVESKLDTSLVVAKRGTEAAGRGMRAALPALQTGVGDRVTVDIRGSASADLLDHLRKVGAGIRAVSEHYSSVRAEVPVSAMESIASRKDVKFVEPAVGAMTAKQLADKPKKKPTKDEKAKQITERTRQALSVQAEPAVSEGDRAHNADKARQQFGVTGIGVKICALSDGIDSLQASQAAGELPAVDVLPGEGGDGDEGTAMLEIIHDLAPNAELGFATAFRSDASFADNIRKLRFQANCDIIVDDVIYFKEAVFQDWIIAQAVNDVTADGALYFSSAGNEGNVVDGTAAHWEGDFVDSGLSIGKWAGTAHNFAGSNGVQIYQPISDASSAGVPVLLNWSDPLGASTNDYDLYLLDRNGNVLSASQNFQNGTQDAYERVNTPSGGGQGLRLAIVKFKGENRYLSLSALRSRFKDTAGVLTGYNTPGEIFGHAAAKNAFAVAAAPAAKAFGRALEPGDPPNPTGPFPGAFGPTSKVERFTSDGPRRIIYNADGTPITPGDVSSTGGEVRKKPDLTAADGVTTTVPDFETFYGTSAAAPHAAAIAGLVLSGNPGLAPADVREALTTTSIDIEQAGFDNRAGSGIILADRVLGYTGASPQPLAEAQTPTVRANDGGNFIDPGDTATVTLPVTNRGDGLAASTSVVLSSPTAGVTITPRSKFYGSIDKGQTAINNFTLTVPANHPLGTPVLLDAKVSFAGAQSPKTARFPVKIGQPSTVVHDFTYTGTPLAIPDNDPTGVTVPIEVSGVGPVSRVTFSIDGTECTANPGATTVGIDHTFVSDLVGTLRSPSGATATLFSGNGSNGKNMCKVVFDDTAARAFRDSKSEDAPYTGSWRPFQPLEGTVGATDGTWTLHVRDAAGRDVGSLRAFSLHVSGYVTPGS